VYVPWGVGKDTMDGTLVYPTVSGDVLSSMRLESFRDGVEEMEYVLSVVSRHASRLGN
jgi:hypothetical protein